MSAKKCVLAYSGGLDTSAIIPWLIDRGYEVHAVLVDVGQEEDLPALCGKALAMGARTAIVSNAKPLMFKTVIPMAIGLAARYEGTYRLGTALARPFIALAQVARAKELGGATLIHGATGKGNDQIRFEFAYHTLAPECPVVAPWKVWVFGGRVDLVNYLRSKGFEDRYDVAKDFSLDENLWHLSIEGGPLEDATAFVDADEIMAKMADRFGGAMSGGAGPSQVEVTYEQGVPVALNGERLPLSEIVPRLNITYRHAPWAWDVVIENRYTGIKSRGIYINPAATLLQTGADDLARTCLNKPSYDRYVQLGADYGTLLYRGEYFSDQREVLETTGRALMAHLNGTVTLHLKPRVYAARILAERPLFRKDIATFEKSHDYSHADAEGFIRLSWLLTIGRTSRENGYADALETGFGVGSGLCGDQPVPEGGLVSSSA